MPMVKSILIQMVLPIMSDLPMRVNDGDDNSVEVDFNVPDSVCRQGSYLQIGR